MKGFSITFLVFVFLAFFVYNTQKNTEFDVLKIYSPSQISIDLNSDGRENFGELIEVKGIFTFSQKPTEKEKKQAQRLGLSADDMIKLGVLTKDFLKKNVEGKKAKIKNDVLFVNEKNYKEQLLLNGFAVEIGKRPNEKLIQNVEKARKLNVVIFNNKSHKFHNLSCKYGLMAHNSQILAVSQLPKDAKPCMFCHSSRYKELKRLRKNTTSKLYLVEVSNIQPPSTEFRSANLEVFLTDYTKVLKPNNNCDTPLCRAIVREINSAANYIDFAIYGYTRVPAIQQALLCAQKRGVKIRFIYDLDEKQNNIYPDTRFLASVFVLNRADFSNAIMHNKFFIFDGKKVLTGSTNLSSTDMSYFNSNAAILISSEKTAGFYAKEFEQMYQNSFHRKKAKIFDKCDDNFNVYFAPKDKPIESIIIPLIGSAENYIYVPSFLITHKALSEALINAHNKGVDVRIILDATNTHTPASKLKALRLAGIPVKTEIFAGKLHSKSIIIDDLYTIIGSMNFSRSGEEKNDENIVVIRNRETAVFYKKFFIYLWQKIPDKWLKFNARAEAPESVGSCSDGIDNDFDGKIDRADEGCVLKR